LFSVVPDELAGARRRHLGSCCCDARHDSIDDRFDGHRGRVD
jgi:hypothetical protein